MKAKAAIRHSPSEADARRQIATVAEDLFAEHGFAGTSMQTIADAAGVNKAMLYYYFKDKRDLYGAIVQAGLDALGGIVDEIAARPIPAREKVAEFARRSYLAMSERPAVVRIIYRELMGVGEKDSLPLREHLGKQLAKLEAIIREGTRRDEFRAVDPGLAVRSLLGMLQIFIKESLVTGETYPARRIVKHTVDVFCRGIAK